KSAHDPPPPSQLPSQRCCTECAQGQDRAIGGVVRYEGCCRSGSPGSVVVFAGVGFDEGHEILDRPRLNRPVDYYQEKLRDCDRYRFEIFIGVIRNIVIQSGIRSVARRDNEYRVPVGRRVCRSAHTNIAVSTAYVLDVKLLAEMLGQLLCDESAE